MKNLYPTIALLSAFCLFATNSVATANSWLLYQTPTTSFISKPANQATGIAAPTLKITANVVSGAMRYTIDVSTSPDFLENLITRTSSVDFQRTLIFTGLDYSTTYYARAKTDNSPYGKVNTFTTKEEEYPIIIQPSNGSDEINPVVLNVVVAPIPGAASYVVELNNKADFSGASRILKTSVKDQTNFIFKDLRYGATYYARAKSDISTAYGPAAKFITRKEIAQKRLWGLTTAAGQHNGGTVFSLSLDSLTFSKHHDYIESGDYPNAYADGSLIHAPDGGFFGNSECERNGTCANGEIFHISPLGEFSYVSKPYIHKGSIMLASNNQLYVVDDWINYFQGGIVQVPATASEFELTNVIFRLRSKSQGRNPNASLIELNDGYLYGMAPIGGATNHGVIYKIKLDGSGFEVLFNFDQLATGAHPQSHLLAGSDGYLYGTTSAGGQFNQGTVFKILPDGSNFKKLIDLSLTTGAQPHGALVEKNKRVFGTAAAGGDHDRGVVFSMNIDGTGFKKLISFNGNNGDAPLTTPTIVDNYVVGMTTWGGVNGKGVIFKMNLDGSSFAKLHDFTAENGANPTGSLLLSEDFFPAAETTLAAQSHGVQTIDAASYAVGVFPNPFINNFTAEISSNKSHHVKVLLTDLYGQTISEINSTSNASITMGDELKKGIYILKVVNGREVTSHRVVKK